MNKRLLIITGERSGLNAILPFINSLSEKILSQIKIIAPHHLCLNESLKTPIKIQSYNGLLFNVQTIWEYFSKLRIIINYVKQEHFSDIMFVDNPEFNLLLARMLKNSNINMYYYIIPQVWAWREYRIKYLKRYFKKIYVIFPFEKEYLKKYGLKSVYVGHPKIKAIENVPSQGEILKKHNLPSNSNIISLFPGTRPNVLKRHFPLFEQTAFILSKNLKGYIFIISDVNKMGMHNWNDIIYSDIPSLELLRISTFALISSGSTTMEAAFLLVPFIGIYKPDPLTYSIGKILLRNPYTVMPNIILNKGVITELITPRLCAEEIAYKTLNILKNVDDINTIVNNLSFIKKTFSQYPVDQNMDEVIKEILA